MKFYLTVFILLGSKCRDLADPAYGQANCLDFVFGKLCHPECEDGYMRDPEEPLYFACDETGVWDPSDTISECLRKLLFILGNQVHISMT